MKKHLSLTSLLLGLLLLLAFSGPNAYAQSDQCPRIYREGEILRTDPAQSYQWYRNGELIPGATQQTFTPTGASANYAVQVAGKASTPFAYELIQVTLIGQAFDEHLRPVANALISVGNQTTQSDAMGRFQLGPVSSSTTIMLSGEKAGHWKSQRRIMPTGHQTHVQIMLRSQPFEHELSAERGGTISRGAFFLTLQPNGVLDANNQPYTGMVKIALNGGRPDDPNFGWMMPGGDFMAQDAQGRERILLSYGFLSAHLQTPDGQPLKLDPAIGAQLRFVMPHTMVSSAPDSLPLWHFDEAAAIWKEEGLARREGAAYIGTVRHFSSWNCDWPGPWCQLRGKTVDCKGRPVAGAPLRLGQQIINSDSSGSYAGRVPATLQFDIQSMNGEGKIFVGPFAEGSENEVEDLTDGSSLYGFGVIDTNNVLTVQSYGIVGKVEYSIDSGATYQTSNRFATQINSSYQIIVRDSIDCPIRVKYGRIARKSACQLLDSASLVVPIHFRSIEEALASNEPVYNLTIQGLSISLFPNTIVHYFPCLHWLSLQDNQLNSLPESIGNLTLLRTINLHGNLLTRIPESFGNLTNLTTLYLGQNQLDTLPESIRNLNRLQELFLFSNQLSYLPESIGNLTGLELIKLDDNKLAKLPFTIGKLSSVKEISIRHNILEELPESIGNLTRLLSLNLGINQLTSLPITIGALSQLQELNLGENKLASLPESVGNLAQLKNLELASNILTILPESIGNLTQLQGLNLTNNPLTSLPESIGNLTQLQGLNLGYNQLTSLPETFGNLKNLRKLNIRANGLTSLPESIGNLTNLIELTLSENRLTNLPESIANLTNLKQLYLTGNPIPPAEQERIRQLLPNCEVIFE